MIRVEEKLKVAKISLRKPVYDLAMTNLNLENSSWQKETKCLRDLMHSSQKPKFGYCKFVIVHLKSVDRSRIVNLL